jgi:hypothetical protein
MNIPDYNYLNIMLNFFYSLVLLIHLIYIIPYILQLYLMFFLILYRNIKRCLNNICYELNSEIKAQYYIFNLAYRNIYKSYTKS